MSLTVLLLTAMAAWGQDVSYNQAKNVASAFFKKHGIASETVVEQKAKQRRPSKAKANNPFYIFNSEDASAFVVVSGDSRTQEVLAYSTEGGFDESNIAPGAAYMLEQYEEYINSLQKVADVPDAQTNVDFGSGRLIETALWNQSYNFWWKECPIVNGANTHAGCVATAMAIFMRHYEWPAKGYGSKSYTSESLGLNLSANFEEINYDWAELPKGNQNDAGWTASKQDIVAKILKQCGVAVNMDYNTDGSSASSDNQIVGLYRYFGYTMGHSIDKESVSDAEWYGSIVDEINSNNLVLYRGESEKTGGHAFICDGYDASGKLHFNFGWSGQSNGYYAIVSSDMEYRNGQSINIGIYPDPDADTREMPDFYLNMAVGDKPYGLKIDGEGIIPRGQSFYTKVSNLFNVADKAYTYSLGLFICDENGTSKLKIGEYASLESNHLNWATIKCAVPYDYEVTENDYLCLFSSTDGGTTWKKVPCFDPELGRIKIIDHYDAHAAQLKMVNIAGKGLGLAVREGSIFNVKDTRFDISAHCLQNCLEGKEYNGEVAAFVCDNGGERKFMISTSEISNLPSHSYYSSWNIGCAISKGSDVVAGDRIYIFTKLAGEDEWKRVKCSDPEKSYIVITEEMLRTTPPQMKMIKVEGQGIGLALNQGQAINLDGTSFTLSCKCLMNNLAKVFDGDVAIFLCDENNKPVRQIGSRTLSGLNPQQYYYSFGISCQIPRDIEVSYGDRLCAFSRLQGDTDWVLVECAEPEKTYIEIPENLIPTTKEIKFSNPYATFCSRHDLDFSSVENIYAYKAIQQNEESVILERVTTVKAGEGVLLRGIEKSEGYYCGNPIIIRNAEDMGDNLFVGVTDEGCKLTQDSPNETKYVLGSLNGNIAFYIADGVSIKAGQAYLSLPNTPNFAPYKIDMSFADDEVTGIESIESVNESAEIYNMQGVKVTNPSNGLYIINGKKIFKHK